MTGEDLRQKLVLMHQASLLEFQREFKFGKEVAIEIQNSLFEGRKQRI